MNTLPNTAATFVPPPVVCATCRQESWRHNFRWTVELGGHEICTRCSSPLKEASRGEDES